MTKSALRAMCARNWMKLHDQARAVLALVPCNDNPAPVLSLGARAAAAVNSPTVAANTLSDDLLHANPTTEKGR